MAFKLSVRGALIHFFLAVLVSFSCLAQEPTSPQKPNGPMREITVGTRIFPPFVVLEKGKLTGFSIELWQEIADQLKLKSRFEIYKHSNGKEASAEELVKAVGRKKYRVAISGISIISDRAKIVEFSQPMFDSGLSIMVRGEQGINVFNILFSMAMLKVLGIFLFVLLVPAHIIWFLARGRDEGLPIAEPYYPGIIDAIFWCAESMAGAAHQGPIRIFARLAALIWVYAGIIFIAYFTAYATTSLTMQTLRSDIKSTKDLSGRKVGVVEGSSSAKYIAELKKTQIETHIVPYPKFGDAAKALLKNKIDAVVYDTPAIQYYKKNKPRLTIAGKQFKPEHYGIIFPMHSPMRLQVNGALLKLKEEGKYQDLKRKWFGEN
jgi:polar amino acid transport system substrate-binding protein